MTGRKEEFKNFGYTQVEKLESMNTLVCSLTDYPGELTCNGTIYYVHQNSQKDEVKRNQSLFWIYRAVYINLV